MKAVSILIVTGVLLAALPARAHHSFAAEFDINQPVTLKGVLTKMEWVNPHGWIYMETKQPDGTTKKWTIETSGPNQMSRRGLKKTDFVDGMSLQVKGYQGIKDQALANGRTLMLTDGRSFYIGSVGGPNDGADK
jgi:Family of unknown function (DUF6152)